MSKATKRPRLDLSQSITSEILSPEYQKKLWQVFPKELSHKEPGLFHIENDPFKTVSFKNFLPEDFAENLLAEIKDLSFEFKENDLFSLFQSQDLNLVQSPYITSVRKFIYNEVKELIEELCSVNFNDQIDLHAIKFEQGNNLLCHSDSLSTRHTAFILYLVPKTWSKESGGNLELFQSDKNFLPTSISKSLTPEFNSFSWFQVSKSSWHQVSEVLEDDIRWSISGWFHSEKPPPGHEATSSEPVLPIEPLESDIDILQKWINPKYLNVEISSKIQSQFQDDSEVSLAEFLLPKKYSYLVNNFVSTRWNQQGPFNKKNMYSTPSSRAEFEEFLNLLKSDAFAILLSHCTGLSLSKNFDDPDGSVYGDNSFGFCEFSVEKWQVGCYSLLRDQDVENLPDRLHMFYHANVHDSYDIDAGGYVSFVSSDSEEPLLVIPPQNNTLSLVFARGDEFSFTKYINAKLQEPFFCISGYYVARDTGDPLDSGVGETQITAN